jgi:nucleoside-diphosphate-sugar epimerase
VTVLVTGARGFVGQRLCQRLMRDGTVLPVGRDETTNLAVGGWTRALDALRPDTIVHLAQSRRYREFPAGAPDLMAVNVGSTFELIQWAAERGVSRFILASTGNVYRPAAASHSESDPCEATTLYAATKLAAEQIVRPYAALLDVVILRFFTIYGPGQQGMLVPDMVDRVQRGVEITLAQGTGPTLTPVFVGDCVEIVARLSAEPPRPQVRVFNVAGNEVLTLRDMVACISNIVGVPALTRAVDDRPTALCGANSAVKTVFDAFTPFAAGVEQMIAAAPSGSRA